MVIATRLLELRDSNREMRIPIRIFLPREEGDGAWSCDYEIDWPKGRIRSAAFGFDSVQAIVLTLQKIGSEVYASDYHQSGKLTWRTPGQGYGFPVPHNIRDLLVGDDAKHL